MGRCCANCTYACARVHWSHRACRPSSSRRCLYRLHIMRPVALVVVLLASVAHSSSGRGSRRRLPDGEAGWRGGDCPCSDPKLCEPIAAPRAQEQVYAFHVPGTSLPWATSNTSWEHYDWSQITTICVFGLVDPQLLCKAHSVGARVTLGADGPPTGHWNDTSAVAKWVSDGVARVKAAHADGLNLDVEISQDDPAQLAALVPACKQMADALHTSQPGSHVTFDTPSEGLTGSTQAKCGQMYGRNYDYKGLSEVVDFFVVMDCEWRETRALSLSPPLSRLPVNLTMPLAKLRSCEPMLAAAWDRRQQRPRLALADSVSAYQRRVSRAVQVPTPQSCCAASSILITIMVVQYIYSHSFYTMLGCGSG